MIVTNFERPDSSANKPHIRKYTLLTVFFTSNPFFNLSCNLGSASNICVSIFVQTLDTRIINYEFQLYKIQVILSFVSR